MGNTIEVGVVGNGASPADLCRRFEPSHIAKRLLDDPHIGADEFLSELIERKCSIDAIQFLAQSLPPRSAIWWGCLCAWHAANGTGLRDEDEAALRAVARWVLDPTAERLHAAQAVAAVPELKSPALRLASAVTFAGSATESGQEPVATDPINVGRLTAAAVLGAGAKIDAVFPQYVAFGVQVAAGENLWNSPGAAVQESD